MKLIVKTEKTGVGFFSCLYAEGLTETVAKTYTTEKPEIHLVATHPQGVSAETRAEALQVLRKGVLSEIKRIEKRADDLRPSEARRLSILKQFIDG